MFISYTIIMYRKLNSVTEKYKILVMYKKFCKKFHTVTICLFDHALT